MKIKVLFALLFLFVTSVHAQFSKAELLSDIDSLEELITTKHVSPYWKNHEENIQAVITEAKTKIRAMDNCDESCLVELMKIVASIQDGHSTISGGSRYDLFGYLPLSTRWFDGELRVMRTIEKHRQILGSKIVAVDGKSISEVLDLLRSVVPQANAYRFQKFVGSYLHLPGLLHGLGITKDAKKAVFSFENGAKTFDLLLEDLPPDEEDKVEFVSYLDNKTERPLYQQNNRDYYWFNYDPTDQLFYFQYNRVGNMKEEGSSAFAQRMWKTVDSLEIHKFVLDLRYNGGGNFPFSLRFVQGILDRLDINRSGRLFIITGYDTFSAAMDMLNELELKSKAIILGEYPCDHPSRPGDPEDYELPNTGIKVYLSSLYHPTAILNDARTSSSLDKEIITSWTDYAAGRDPVLDYIKAYKGAEPKIVAAKSHKDELGNYAYSPTRNLRLKDVNGELWLEISRALETPIYQVSGDRYRTEVPGLELELDSRGLLIHYPDGREMQYQKLTDPGKAAVDLLYEGDFENAKAVLLKIKQNNPDFIDLKDHMMCFMANITYFDLLKYPDVKAAAIAKGILDLGIELNDGKAPFCEYTLRFYQ